MNKNLTLAEIAAIEALLRLSNVSKAFAEEAEAKGENSSFHRGASLAYTLAAEQVTFYLTLNTPHVTTDLA